MATATYKPAKTKTEIVEVEPEQITLTLSHEEARVIQALTSHCLDVDDSQYGKEIRSINNALSDHVDYFGKVQVRAHLADGGFGSPLLAVSPKKGRGY